MGDDDRRRQASHQSDHGQLRKGVRSVREKADHSRDHPSRKYVGGDRAALTDKEKRGLKLFVGKAACNECHNGPILSDSRFHNIGVPQSGNHIPAVDTGRYGDIPKLLGNPYRGEEMFSDDPAAGKMKLDEVRANETDGMGVALDFTKGEFRTGGLLNIAETAPYFHDGSMRTLEDVVQFYNRGGGATGLVLRREGRQDRAARPHRRGRE